MLFDYIQKLKLMPKMDPLYLKTLALEYMEKNKFYETATIILHQP